MCDSKKFNLFSLIMMAVTFLLWFAPAVQSKSCNISVYTSLLGGEVAIQSYKIPVDGSSLGKWIFALFIISFIARLVILLIDEMSEIRLYVFKGCFIVNLVCIIAFFSSSFSSSALSLTQLSETSLGFGVWCSFIVLLLSLIADFICVNFIHEEFKIYYR